MKDLHCDLNLEITKASNADVTTNIIETNGVIIVDIFARYEGSCISAPITLTWYDKMLDIAATWNPVCDRSHSIKQWFRPTEVPSNLYYGSPLFASVRNNGKNNAVVALSDTIKPAEISFCVEDFEEKDEVRYQVTLLAKEVDEISEYHTQLRIDRRDIDFYQAVLEASNWMRKVNQIEKYVPRDAELPLYSTWYNFHQNPREAILLEELKRASEIGFKTVIIDDGWQFAGRGTGDYVNCGDWEVTHEKFKDFGAFVDYIHSIGMKAMLWFPVPFVGYNTRDYQAFKNKLLYNDESLKAGIYDVRYADVRKHIIATYVKFVDVILVAKADSEMIAPYREIPAKDFTGDSARDTVYAMVVAGTRGEKKILLQLDSNMYQSLKQWMYDKVR